MLCYDSDIEEVTKEVIILKNLIKANYSSILKAIKVLLQKDMPSIVAIDGMCGSGKSSLAALIAENLDCNVFHMDDYFLPLEMKTQDRLAQPGGNVHYERFKEEILNPLLEHRTITYRPYLCGLWKYGEAITAEPKKLTVIEGTYCLHPTLRDAYDLKIFLSISEEMQLQRILQRNGEEKLQQFIHKWIPLETLYFDRLGIATLCDITLDTTQL
jgi:uridine kinase